jgi:hypothetical protein
VQVIDPSPPLRIQEQRRQIALSPEVLAAYAGSYTGSPSVGITIRIAVRARGSRLFMQSSDWQDEVEAFPEAETRFFVPDWVTDISFEKGALGGRRIL